MFKIESDADLSALINYHASNNLTQLILEKISPLDDTLADFLRYEDLLGKAILFFFRELMRKENSSRVAARKFMFICPKY